MAYLYFIFFCVFLSTTSFSTIVDSNNQMLIDADGNVLVDYSDTLPNEMKEQDDYVVVEKNKSSLQQKLESLGWRQEDILAIKKLLPPVLLSQHKNDIKAFLSSHQYLPGYRAAIVDPI